MLPDLSMPFYLSLGALWILVILHSLILLGVLRIVYQLQQTGAAAGNRGLSAGKEAPTFSAADLYGAPISSADFAGRLTALLFVSPDCPSCTEVLKGDMEYLKHKAQGNVIVICRSEHEDCARLAEEHGLDTTIIADEDDQISRLYEIFSVPTTVIIDADNRIRSYGQPQREELEAIYEKASELDGQGVI